MQMQQDRLTNASKYLTCERKIKVHSIVSTVLDD